MNIYLIIVNFLRNHTENGKNQSRYVLKNSYSEILFETFERF